MTTEQTAIARADYIGATTGELSSKDAADRVAAGVSQKVLFQRRGEIQLYPDRLVLRAWSEGADLELARTDIRTVGTRFTALYGRFIGGLLNAGKPLIIDSEPAGEFYLLINRREFMETTDDRRWEKLINEWLAEARRG
jgi:hypothetical protein